MQELTLNIRSIRVHVYLFIYTFNPYLKSLRASGRIRPPHSATNPLYLLLRLLRCSSLSILRHFFPFLPSYAKWSWACLLLVFLLVATSMLLYSHCHPPSVYVRSSSTPPDLTADVICVCHPLYFLIADPSLPSHS